MHPRLTPKDPIMPTSPTLTVPALEQVYDTLAQAIDQAGPERTELFLVKLALMNAQALGDADVFAQHVQAALRDI